MDHVRNTLGVEDVVSKVPAVTLGFWIIKIFATTLGETGGDAVTMTLGLGYLGGTAIFAAVLIAAVGAQIGAKRFHPFIYWFAIVATTTVGTTMADFCDPLARHRLRRRLGAAVHLADGHARTVVLGARLRVRRHGDHAQS